MLDPYLLFEDLLLVYILVPALTDESKENYFVEDDKILNELDEDFELSDIGFEEIGYSIQ